MYKGFLFFHFTPIFCVLVLAACGPMGYRPGSTVDIPSQEEIIRSTTLTPFQPEGHISPPTVTVMPIPGVPSQTLVPQYLWISTAAPEALRQYALQSGLQLAVDTNTATVRLDVSRVSDSQSTAWTYVLVAPFPTTTDDVSLVDIQNSWNGIPSGPFAGRPLWVEESTLAAFTAFWGEPATGAVRVATTDQLVDAAWADRPAWGIVPFEELEPRWKVLSVDGQSPIRNDFNPLSYPLIISFDLQPEVFSLIPYNRDPEKLTVLAMTGVTALVRATADRMEKDGILYPGEEVRAVLRAADITHISNEVPFMVGCPIPDPWTSSLQFCSDPRYIALLEDVGTDVVELTGNHLLDYGSQPIFTTLDMYDRLRWPYFGGGRNLQDSRQPALVEDHGNKLAFVGCNFVGPPDDWATNDSPGSANCDFDQLSAEIGTLRSEGYLPIMTFQYDEYYQPEPTSYEQDDFRRMAESGAVIVSGSQAHVPAALEFSGGSIIHYGLGNLFFDQMSHLMPDGSLIYDTRNVFIDRHIFYSGRYISTELLSYIIEDYSRPRLMTASERLTLLHQIFAAGGW